MSVASQPVILLIDDDRETLAELREVVERRYGADYHVLPESSTESGLTLLHDLRTRNADLALVVADQWMPGMTGVDFLSRVHDLHPDAKRVLVIDAMDQRASAPLAQALALGRIDQHVHRPWQPAEDLLHPVLTELLAEWTRRHRPRFEAVRIVGNRWDARSHELRDLLDRNNVPHGFYDADSEPGRNLLRELGATDERLPVVSLYRGPTIVQPSNVDVADAFGVKTRAPDDVMDLAVIGAGPAGLAAAVYGSSEGLHTVVLEREAMGGQAGTSSMIRNYLGFPRGVSGTELAQRAYSQAWSFGTQFIFTQEARQLRAEGEERRVALTGGTEIRARAVVLATGVAYRRLGVPGIDRHLGAGVFYGAATTEGKAMTGQHVWVVGAANSAGQAAVHLARYADRVTLLARGDSLAATMSAYLLREIERAKNIEVRLNTRVIDGRGEQRLEGILLENTERGAREEVDAVALFILIGAAPHTAWLGDAVARDRRGFVLTGGDLSTGLDGEPRWPLARPPRPFETSLPGVFAVGDVRHGSIKRVASAVGEGSIAVSFIHEYLRDS